MQHTSARLWDHSLKAMFDEIDDYLEEAYGHEYPLHPNRPRRGKTSNKEMDGLFNIGADFTAGYGSHLGRGYVVQVRMSTLEHIPREVRRQIESKVMELVRRKLLERFPNRRLSVERDGQLIKIVGDTGLGSVLRE